MREFEFGSLGRTWLQLVRGTLERGTRMSNEGVELLGVSVRFPIEAAVDPMVQEFGDPTMIAEMKKVFFAEGPNALGHSYAGLMQGPGGRNDLEDVIELLRTDSWTKRAVLSLSPIPNRKVPCVNVVQFLVRENRLELIYFARGQDAYKKFYADGLCLSAMGVKVAKALGIPAGTLLGFIGSSHVYDADRAEIERKLAAANLDRATTAASSSAGLGKGAA